MKKALSAEGVKLKGDFETVRDVLHGNGFDDRLDKPLAYWAQPDDRRLPFAFLGRTISELLGTKYEDLLETPGIGQRKIETLVTLLRRAIDQPPITVFDAPPKPDEEQKVEKPAPFNASTVSDSEWSKWKDTVRRHNLGIEPMGRLAPSLQALPTVIWETPLADYLELTLNELQTLKTHGEKRVTAILEVFYFIHRLLDGADTHGCYAVRLTPGYVADIESWIARVTQNGYMPNDEEIRAKLLDPVFHQILVDAGGTPYDLICGRLGIDAEPENVRDQSKRLGVTRARVYQILEDCQRVMHIRWPQGRGQLTVLLEKVSTESPDSSMIVVLNELRTLLFPVSVSGQSVTSGSAEA
jgi:hypothetical protein